MKFNRKKFEKELNESNTEKINDNEPEENYMSIGMCLGTSLGMMIGLLIDGIGLGTGMCVGLCLGMLMGMSIKKDKDDE